MAYDNDDDNNKTSIFVDFLMEDEDKLDLVPSGEADSSAMEFDVKMDTGDDLFEMDALDGGFGDEPDLVLEGMLDETKSVSLEPQDNDFSQGESELESVDSSADEVAVADDSASSVKSEEEFATVLTDSAKLEVVEDDSIEHGSATGTTDFDPMLKDDSVLMDIESDGDKSLEQAAKAAKDEPVFNFEVEPTTEIQTQVVEEVPAQGAGLKLSENLRRAQDRILELESEIDKLRLENQDLGSAGEVLKRKLDELTGEVDRLSRSRKESEGQLKEEVQHSQVRIGAKNQEISELKVKVESLELRLKRDFQMVRVRERELENRLELVKLENSAVLRSKDEHILDLKRKMDQSQMEIEQMKDRLRVSSQDGNSKHDKIRRTVRTLRLALNMLDEETGEESKGEFKKSS